MHLKRSRFSDLSHEDLIRLLNMLEGPLLEIVFQAFEDVTSGGVNLEVWLDILHDHDPAVQALRPTLDEWCEWERFKEERGVGVSQIGEFVYGPDENPWREV